MPIDPRDHVPDELRRPVVPDIGDIDGYIGLMMQASDSLADSMDAYAAMLHLIGSQPKAQDLLTRGAAAIRQLQDDLAKVENEAGEVPDLPPLTEHFKRVCAEHGSLLTQCRCPDPNKRVDSVPCPGRGRCPGASR